jgi:hypothetical protein
MTIATLGLAVQSGQVKQATPELQNLAAAAGQAEVAAERLRAATASGATAQSTATAAVKMHTAALHADAAAARMMSNTSRMLAFQLNDVAVSLASGMNPAMVAMQQGSQIAQLGFREVGQAALGMAVRFGPAILAAGALAAGVAGLTHEINKTSAVTVEFGDVALATWQVISGGIWHWVKPAVDAIAPWFASAWDTVVKITHDTGNMIVRDFVGTTDYIVTAFSLIPDAVVASTEAAANMMLTGIEEMIQEAIAMINGLISNVNGMTASLGIPKLAMLGSPESFQMGRVDIGGRAAQANIDRTVGAYNTRQDQNYATDYMGQFFGAVSDQSQANALKRMQEEAEGATKATKALANDGFGQLVGMTNTFADATRNAFSNLGTGIIDAFRKGGDVASNFFSMILDKVGQVGESLLNTGLNSLLDIGINAIFGGIGGGIGSGAIGRGVYGGMGGFFPGFPGMAEGGTVAGAGMSWVGERGPELMYMPKGAQVIPNAPSMAIAANSNGGGITIGNLTIQANSREEGAAAADSFVTQLRRHFPSEMDRYQRNPQRRYG